MCLFPYVFCGNDIIAGTQTAVLNDFQWQRSKYNFDEKGVFLALKAGKFLRDGDPKSDLTSADGDSGAVWMKMDYSLEPITPTNLSSSSPERREAGAGREGDSRREGSGRETEISGLWRRWRWWWRKKGGRDHTEFVGPHSSSPEPVAAHPVTLGRRPQLNTREKKVSQRPWGPTTGQSSPQSLYTHTHTHTIPILIPHAPLTSLLKHRSKSPDWSQRLRNKWRQIPDFCMAFSAGRHERAPAAGFGIPLVHIYSDIGNVVPNSPHDFGVGRSV